MNKETKELSWIEIFDILKIKQFNILKLLVPFLLVVFVYLSYFAPKDNTAYLDIHTTGSVQPSLYKGIQDMEYSYAFKNFSYVDQIISIEKTNLVESLYRELKDISSFKGTEKFFENMNLIDIQEKFEVEIFSLDEYFKTENYDVISVSFDNYKSLDDDLFKTESDAILDIILSNINRQLLTKLNQQINLIKEDYIRNLKNTIMDAERDLFFKESEYESKLATLLLFLSEQLELSKILEQDVNQNIVTKDFEPKVFNTTRLNQFTLSGLFWNEKSKIIKARIDQTYKKDINWYKKNNLEYVNVSYELGELKKNYKKLEEYFAVNIFAINADIFETQSYKKHTVQKDKVNISITLIALAVTSFFLLNVFFILRYIYQSSK